MIERIVSHPAGRFQRCRHCAAEPRHVSHHGRSSTEPVTFTATAPRHSVQCRCGARTPIHTTLAAAEKHWGTDYAQLALPIRARRTRRAA